MQEYFSVIIILIIKKFFNPLVMFTLQSNLARPSLRTADAFSVIASLPPLFFGGREAMTGNASAVRRLDPALIAWLVVIKKISQLQLVYSYHPSNIPFSVKKSFLLYQKSIQTWPHFVSFFSSPQFYLMNSVKLQTWVPLTSPGYKFNW